MSTSRKHEGKLVISVLFTHPPHPLSPFFIPLIPSFLEICNINYHTLIYISFIYFLEQQFWEKNVKYHQPRKFNMYDVLDSYFSESTVLTSIYQLCFLVEVYLESGYCIPISQNLHVFRIIPKGYICLTVLLFI